MESTLIGQGIRCMGRDYEIVGMTGGDHYSEGGYEVFDVFDLSDYTFLQIDRNSITGNRIVGSYSAQGVFKQRAGLIQSDNSENVEQGATLHIRPTESFVSEAPSNREHLTLTLVPADFSDYEESS